VRFATAKQPRICGGRMPVQLLRLFFCLFRPEIHLTVLAQLPSAPVSFFRSPLSPAPPFLLRRPHRLMRTPLKARIHKWTELCTGNVFKPRFHIRWPHTIRATRLFRDAQQRKYPPSVLFHGAVHVGHPTLLAETTQGLHIRSGLHRPHENDAARSFFARFACVKSGRAIMDSHTRQATSAQRVSPCYHDRGPVRRRFNKSL